MHTVSVVAVQACFFTMLVPVHRSQSVAVTPLQN
jgi:hypothetical protein